MQIVSDLDPKNYNVRIWIQIKLNGSVTFLPRQVDAPTIMQSLSTRMNQSAIISVFESRSVIEETSWIRIRIYPDPRGKKPVKNGF